jgi:hypothetical protein
MMKPEDRVKEQKAMQAETAKLAQQYKLVEAMAGSSAKPQSNLKNAQTQLKGIPE